MKKVSVLVLVSAFLMAGSAFAGDTSSMISDSSHSSSSKSWTPSLAISQSNLSQSNAQGVNQTSIAAELSYSHAISNSGYSVGADLSSTLASLNANSNMSGSTVYFVNADLFASHKIVSYNAWDLSMNAGGAYRTAFTKNSSFGYSNMTEVQLQPMISKSFSKGSEASVYGKYNPVVHNGFAFNNREIAIGSGYNFAQNSSGHSMIMNAEWASQNFDVNGGVKSETMTIGLGYSL